MKKILGLVLGASLLIATAGLAYEQDAKNTATSKSKSKSKKKKTTKSTATSTATKKT